MASVSLVDGWGFCDLFFLFPCALQNSLEIFLMTLLSTKSKSKHHRVYVLTTFLRVTGVVSFLNYSWVLIQQHWLCGMFGVGPSCSRCSESNTDVEEERSGKGASFG